MSFSSWRHVVLLVLAATSQVVLGESPGQALGKRTMTPHYNGNWVRLVGGRFEGIYQSHIIPPENLATLCSLAAKNMREQYEALPLARKPAIAPQAMTTYQNTAGDLVFASSGAGEHGEELAARIVPGGLNGGSCITYSFRTRAYVPACGPGARNCAAALARANVDDIQPKIERSPANVSPASSKEPSVSPKDSPSPKENPRRRRSLEDAAAFVSRRRDLQSFTVHDVRAALAEGIRAREALDRYQDLLLQRHAALQRREAGLLEVVY